MNETIVAAMALHITRAEPIADGIYLFELRDPDGHELPRFTPGAHISIKLLNGSVRKYSLCNNPHERDRYVIAVQCKRGESGFSTSLIDDFNAGNRLNVTVPVNDFELPPDEQSFIFIVGGIGITPIISMIRYLRTTEGKQFRLYYCTRSPEVTAFREELSAPELKDMVTIHHDQGVQENSLDLRPILEHRRNLEHLFCCGPRPLMQAVRNMTEHWPPSSVHFEAFNEPERNTGR